MTNETQEPSSEQSPSGAHVTPQKRSAKKPAMIAVVLLAVLVIAIVVWKTADSDKSPTTTTVPQTTETTLNAAEQKVLTDYRAFWDAYITASNPMRPDHPDLAAHSTGEEYAQLVNSFSGARASNVIFKGTIDLDPKVASINGDEASVMDCIDDKTGSYDVTTGERQDTDDGRKHLSKAILKLVDGTWKVSKLHSLGFGCAGP